MKNKEELGEPKMEFEDTFSAETVVLKSKLKETVIEAVKEVGVENFKKTNLFMSNDMRSHIEKGQIAEDDEYLGADHE